MRPGCSSCGAKLEPGKIGCPNCGAIANPARLSDNDGVILLSDGEAMTVERVCTGFGDVNFGSPEEPGVPLQAVTLMGGRQGCGKSRFTMRWLSLMAEATGKNSLLIQLEEPRNQVIARAHTLQIPNLNRIHLYSLESAAENQGVDIEGLISKYKPGAVVLDSMQKVAGDDVMLAVKVASNCKRIVGLHKCPMIITSQVTKSDDFEGLNKLQHEVDILTFFSQEEAIQLDDGRIVKPETAEPFRCLETKIKNRFGMCGMTSWFHMRKSGLVPFDPESYEGGD